MLRVTPRSARSITLAVLCTVQFILIVDVVVVNVALPSIRSALAIPDGQLQFTGIAYTLVFGSLLIVAGRAGDLFGRRRLLLVGLATFVAASLLSGAAQSGWQLFAARGLQGLGAALVSPNALASLTATFREGAERNRALGVWAAVGSGGAIAGQLLGGIVTDLFGWRWIFLLNVPIGIVAAVVLLRVLPDSRGERSRLDVRGAALLVAALAVFTFGLSRVAEHGVTAGAVAVAGIAVALLAVFVVVERRHPAPLVRFGLLRNGAVRVGNAVLALQAAAVTGALFFTTLYLQVSLDYSPLAVGFAFAPVTVIVLIVSPFAGGLVERLGVRRLLLAGAASAFAGFVLLTRVSADGSYLTDVLPGLALVAAGSGLSYAPTFVAGSTGVRDDDQGLASGLLNTAQELGAALGLALLASIATATAAGATGSALSGYRVGYVGAAVMALVAGVVALRAPGPVSKQEEEGDDGARDERRPTGAASSP